MKYSIKASGVFCVLFILLTGGMFALAVYSEFHALHNEWMERHVERWDATKEFGKKPNLQTTKSFPSTSSGQTQLRTSSIPQTTKLARFNKAIDKGQRWLERALGRDMVGRIPFVLIQKSVDRYLLRYNVTTSHNGTALNNTFEKNIIVKTSDGWLTFLVDSQDNSESINHLIHFGKQQMAAGRQLLFVEAPAKSPSLNDLHDYPTTYADHFSEQREKIIHSMAKAGIPTLSLTKEIVEKTDSMLFFRTDHHWLPQTAMRANQLLAQELNVRYGYRIPSEMYSLDQYDISMSRTLMLGSQGLKVTEIYCEPERLPILMPRYHTDLTVFKSNTNDTVTGSIQQTLFDYSRLEPETKYDNNRWGFYGYGNNAYICIHNNRLHDGKRILLLKESFPNAMYPYMCHMAEWIDVIDVERFAGSLQLFIEKIQPQTVIVAYSSRSFQDSENYRTSAFFNFN